MAVNGIDHYNIACADLDVSRKFYDKVLDMKEGSRPPFDTPGAWLYAGGHPILHLSPRKMRPTKTTGRFDHIALFAEDLPGVLRKMKRLKIEHAVRVIPEMEGNAASGGRQVFLSRARTPLPAESKKFELHTRTGLHALSTASTSRIASLD